MTHEYDKGGHIDRIAKKYFLQGKDKFPIPNTTSDDEKFPKPNKNSDDEKFPKTTEERQKSFIDAVLSKMRFIKTDLELALEREGFEIVAEVRAIDGKLKVPTRSFNMGSPPYSEIRLVRRERQERRGLFAKEAENDLVYDVYAR